MCRRAENFCAPKPRKRETSSTNFFWQALAHPEIASPWCGEDKIALQLPTTTSLRDRIRDLYGARLLDDLLESPCVIGVAFRFKDGSVALG